MEESPKIDLNPKVPELPMFENQSQVDFRYMVISPYVSIHVHWDNTKHEIVYEVEEPMLNTEEKFLFAKLKEEVEKALSEETILEKNVSDVLTYLHKIAMWTKEETEMEISEESYKKIYYYLYRDLVGLNELDPLFKDPYVEEIKYNGIKNPVFIRHRIYGVLSTNIKYDQVNSAVKYVEKLARRCEKEVSTKIPAFEGLLQDDSIINANYNSEITFKGPTFIIKKPVRVHWTPIQLLDIQVLSPESLSYLWILMQHKANILIVGDSQSRKTSLLNSLRLFIPIEKSIANIEGSEKGELKKKWFSKEKVPKGDASGKIKEVFNNNPDYVFSENLSSKESLALFQSMLSDYGTITTIEAKDGTEAIKKLLSDPINLSPNLVNNIDAVVVLSKAFIDGKEVKKVDNVSEISYVNSVKDFNLEPISLWDQKENKFYFKSDSKAFQSIMEEYDLNKEDLLREFETRKKVILELHRRRIMSPYGVHKNINNYHENPEQVLAKLDIVE
ncbi:ATPase, T2SS/T4P/T4SS family [Nanoarchaeota archaeon]